MGNPFLESLLGYIAHAMDCRPLQDKDEREAATKLVEWLGFPSHHDPQKNWDTLKCLLYVTSLGDKERPVLDAGSGARGVVLRWLHQVGYRNLYACDLKPVKTDLLEEYGIKFTPQDLVDTSYEDGMFQAVTSVSVIEHDVPLDDYVKEMYRILRPGGLLLTSTDYWSEPVDCAGIYPYGKDMGQMKVFQPREIGELVAMAEATGFELCRPLVLGTGERAVRWDRVDREYTFAFIALRKKSWP